MPLTSFPTSFSFHSISFCLPGTESCCRECTNSLAVREKSDKMNVCGALLCRMTCCKNTTVFWKVTLEMASWEWVGEGYVYYLLMTSRSSLLSLQVKGKKKKKTNHQKNQPANNQPFFNCLLCSLSLRFKNHAVLISNPSITVSNKKVLKGILSFSYSVHQWTVNEF